MVSGGKEATQLALISSILEMKFADDPQMQELVRKFQ